jgi:putative membrane protein
MKDPRDSTIGKSIGRIISSNKQPLDCEAITISDSDEEFAVYGEYPLVQDLLRYEPVRNCSFQCHGFDQFKYPAGNGGWIQTLCIVRGRALHHIIIPWLVITLHSVAVILFLELGNFNESDIANSTGDWGTFYGLVLNVILSFLLVFRLNRAAQRYWLAREFWGRLIAYGRSLTSGILNHGSHHPVLRDDAIRWVAAATVSVMCFMRGDSTFPKHCLDGILDKDSMAQLEVSKHTPIYASDRVRDSLKRLFYVTADTPAGLAHAWTVQLDRLEGELNDFMMQFGGMERIRATPLPIVYVSHLRTFLIIHLMLFPYVFGPHQGWLTIPLTMITAFAFLGIEGASMEVENPFKKGVNNLNMDALTMALIQNIQQQVQSKADLEISRKIMSA